MRGYIYLTDNKEDLYNQFINRYQYFGGLELPETYKGLLSHAEVYVRNTPQTYIELLIRPQLTKTDFSFIQSLVLNIEASFDVKIEALTQDFIKISSARANLGIRACKTLIELLTGQSAFGLETKNTYKLLVKIYANIVPKHASDICSATDDTTLTIYPLLAFRDIKTVVTSGLVKITNNVSTYDNAAIASIAYNLLKSNGLLHLSNCTCIEDEDITYIQQCLLHYFAISLSTSSVKKLFNVP